MKTNAKLLKKKNGFSKTEVDTVLDDKDPKFVEGKYNTGIEADRRTSHMKSKAKLLKKKTRVSIKKVDTNCLENKDLGSMEVGDKVAAKGTKQSKECGSNSSSISHERKTKATSKTKIAEGVPNSKKLDVDLTIMDRESEDNGNEDAVEIVQISGVMDDYSRGMKKWLLKYRQSRPGLKILQQQIDDFIIAHEAQLEQERKERDAQASEGGWTVARHQKGRKKTTDSESGITVGSVAPAAVLDNLAKKKNKEPLLDFYRFQRREAQRNKVMMLQTKLDEDRKKLQQLRAARKFRPY